MCPLQTWSSRTTRASRQKSRPGPTASPHAWTRGRSCLPGATVQLRRWGRGGRRHGRPHGGGGGLNAHFSSESPSFISFFLHRNLSPSPQYCSGTSPFQLSLRTACILTSEITSSLCESSRDPGKVPLGANSRLCPPRSQRSCLSCRHGARRQQTSGRRRWTGSSLVSCDGGQGAWLWTPGLRRTGWGSRTL